MWGAVFCLTSNVRSLHPILEFHPLNVKNKQIFKMCICSRPLALHFKTLIQKRPTSDDTESLKELKNGPYFLQS